MKIKGETLVLSQFRFRNWILDAFWRESSEALGLNPAVKYLFSSKNKNVLWKNLRLLNNLSTRPILSIHQSNLLLLREAGVLNEINQHNVLVTHTNSQEEVANLINYYSENSAARFLVMNKDTMLNLALKGIPKGNISVVYGAVDRKIFSPSKKMISGDYVLVAGDCKPRKNPDLIRHLVESNPSLKFMFESYSWKKIFRNTKRSNSNISFWIGNSLSRGDLYRNASALCSLSFLEGGPIPVLQALASGTPILSSDVGFVKEVLPEGFGEVINLDLNIKEISDLLRRVVSTKRLVCTADGLNGNFSWEDLGRELFTFHD